MNTVMLILGLELLLIAGLSLFSTLLVRDLCAFCDIEPFYLQWVSMGVTAGCALEFGIAPVLIVMVLVTMLVFGLSYYTNNIKPYQNNKKEVDDV